MANKYRISIEVTNAVGNCNSRFIVEPGCERSNGKVLDVVRWPTATARNESTDKYRSQWRLFVGHGAGTRPSSRVTSWGLYCHFILGS